MVYTGRSWHGTTPGGPKRRHAFEILEVPLGFPTTGWDRGVLRVILDPWLGLVGMPGPHEGSVEKGVCRVPIRGQIEKFSELFRVLPRNARRCTGRLQGSDAVRVGTARVPGFFRGAPSLVAAVYSRRHKAEVGSKNQRTGPGLNCTFADSTAVGQSFWSALTTPCRGTRSRHAGVR